MQLWRLKLAPEFSQLHFMRKFSISVISLVSSLFFNIYGSDTFCIHNELSSAILLALLSSFLSESKMYRRRFPCEIQFLPKVTNSIQKILLTRLYHKAAQCVILHIKQCGA
jgi:hypothetical protein